MRVIWKRPDGFLGASPDDFSVLELDGHSRIWLHKRNKDHYPFQVAGGWEEQQDTVRLNNLINLLPAPKAEWVTYLNNSFNHWMKDDKKEYCEYLKTWLAELAKNLKGDTWELEILGHAIQFTEKRLGEASQDFLKA